MPGRGNGFAAQIARLCYTGRVTKADLRSHFAASLRTASPETRTAASIAICAAIRAHAAWREARVVCAFLPLPSEPQLAGLWAEEDGRAFCFPRVRAGEVDLIRVDDRRALLTANWKLDTPALADAPLVAPAQVDLFLVPGLAFTTGGARLGRGGGYYDRLLPRRGPLSTALGVCFALQLVAELPGEAHDQPVDAVVTERGA